LQFLSQTADNCEMDDDTFSFSDEFHGAARRPEGDPGLEMREPYLQRVLADFEAGRLEAYEYTRRVLAINAAGSTDEMHAIVNTPPVGPDGPVGSDDSRPGAAGALSPGLDAVDLARLRATRLAESRSPNARYITLAVVFVLFAVLIGVGMWLASHVHGSALSPSLHRHAVTLRMSWWG
jgi:hypothetical protein